MNLQDFNCYIPPNSSFFVEKWLKDHSVVLKITRRRETKLGDYRRLPENNKHQITVNGDLNLYAFFFVFTHEVAHLKTFVQYKPKRVTPHGREWKCIFGELLAESIDIYPDTLKQYILNHARRPKASLGADPNISKYIINEAKQGQSYLEDIEFGTMFFLGKRIFRKESKQKKRFICLEIKSNRRYLISPTSVVDQLD